MALTFLTDHAETIYDIDKVRLREKPQRTWYKSKRSQQLQAEQLNQKSRLIKPDGTNLLTGGSKHESKTFGVAELPLPDPKQFLRKGQGIKWQRKSDHVCPPSAGTPPLPKFDFLKSNDQQNKTTVLTRKQEVELKKKQHLLNKPQSYHIDFIQRNIDGCKGGCNVLKPPRYVDTHHGRVQNLMNTGLIPQHVCGRNYGKVPNYLKKHKEMMTECKRIVQTEDNSADPSSVRAGLRLLSEQERQELLKGLRVNLKERYREFQTQPLFIDNPHKAKRKDAVDNEVQQLENDIRLLESNPIIYVACD